MENKIIRLATENDAVELSRLNQAFNGGNLVDPEVIKECIQANNELIAVALLNGRVVGFACAQSFRSFCYSNSFGEITEMYVEEESRLMGFARLMISLLEEKLLERGVKSIKILTGKDNEAAISTYLRSNYTIENDVVLEKTIR